METAEERDRRIARLEAARADRKAETPGGIPGGGVGSTWPTPDDAGTGVIPLELAPGRGDLNYSAGFVPTFPTALALINRTVSFARIFQTQPWVAAAVMRMLTWGVRVPLKCYRRSGDENDRVRLRPGDHPIADAIENPWPGGNQAQLIMSLLGPILVHGNSVTEIDDTARSGAITLAPKDWRFCSPIMPWRDSLEGFRFDVDIPDLVHEVSIDKVIHAAWWSPIGPIGTSPLQQLGITINIEDAAQRYQQAMFRQGGRPSSAVIASEAFLGIDPNERKQIMAQLRKDLINLYGGPENAGKPALLPPGLDWKPVGQTSEEAQLIDQRKVAREEIAGVYLIPPPLLGVFARESLPNIEWRDMVYTDTLGPPLVLLEQTINAQVIRDLLQDPDVFVEFDFGAVLRGKREEEITALRNAIGGAMMTPNESRAVLNMPRSNNPAMDEFYLPVNNLQPIGAPPTNPQMSGEETPPIDSMPGAKRLHVRSRDADYDHVIA